MKSKNSFDRALFDQFYLCPSQFLERGSTRASKYDCLAKPAMQLYLKYPDITIEQACYQLNRLYLQLPSTEEACSKPKKLQHPIMKSTLYYNLLKWGILLKETK